MKFMIIRNTRSSGSFGEMIGKVVKSKVHRNYSGNGAAELIKTEHPLFVSLKLKEPVNGDNDMMNMLSSIDVNTRLRVSIIDTETIKNYFGSVFMKTKNYNLPGAKT